MVTDDGTEIFTYRKHSRKGGHSRHDVLTAESKQTKRRSVTSAASPYELRAVAADENAASPARAMVAS